MYTYIRRCTRLDYKLNGRVGEKTDFYYRRGAQRLPSLSARIAKKSPWHLYILFVYSYEVFFPVIFTDQAARISSALTRLVDDPVARSFNRAVAGKRAVYICTVRGTRENGKFT